ncbi:MAG TPA: TAXI family TRAP transporter solute-binding subunit, partial [Burkholderiales bacterium]|nr:TAXI family TRAP transporter solute-binding subunit [Burkholderiales bacterium]
MLRTHLAGTLAKIEALFGKGLVVSMGAILLFCLLGSAAALVFMDSATPDTITVAAGPKGSVFWKIAEKYKKILSAEGVLVKILPSEGSMDNFRKLSDPKVHVDVGFVLGGETGKEDVENLVSLGSISYQPLMIFYRGKTKTLLSEFRGQRIDIGEKESGTHTLAQALLKANGFEPGDGTHYADIASGNAADALLDGRIDAIFMMGESSSIDIMRKLLHTPGIRLFDFIQADGYTRRIPYLNKLVLPQGSLDLGKDIPDHDVNLVGPTVELVARKDLHPALSDLLLEAAREVHGRAGLFKKQGEFPSPIEHEFRISPDALRYYKTGKSFLYRTFPYWMASYIARALAVILPVMLLLIPA